MTVASLVWTCKLNIITLLFSGTVVFFKYPVADIAYLDNTSGDFPARPRDNVPEKTTLAFTDSGLR